MGIGRTGAVVDPPTVPIAAVPVAHDAGHRRHAAPPGHAGGDRRHAAFGAHRRWPWFAAAGAAGLVLAAVAVVGLAWVRPQPAVPAPVSVSENRPAALLAGYAGSWRSHGLAISFDATGRGSMDFRTYTPCSEPEPGVPCEPHGPEDVGHATVVLEPTAVGGLQLRTVATNDASDQPVGQTQPVRVVRAGVLEVGTGDASWGLCRTETYDPICGA